MRQLTSIALVLSLFVAMPASAATIEFLQSPIDPDNVGWLAGLACRNLDRLVHLDISVTWPSKAADIETDGYRRLVFWNETDEYLFARGTFKTVDDKYVINGYFRVRSGGIHQGIVSNYFEKAKTPGAKVVETQRRNADCTPARNERG